MDTFEQLVSEAERQPFSGWDFSYLDDRYEESKVSWNLREIILQESKQAGSLLDLGTGGGEFLSTLQPLPKTTCATEGYAPNTSIAKRCLRPFGVEVLQTFCEENGGTTPQRGALPFRTETFDIVTDRHEAYITSEVYRVLKPDGVFITQQVGDGNNAELRESFQGGHVSKAQPSWELEKAVVELKQAGFHIREQRAESAKSRFFDIGAIVYYLKAIPWEIPDFSTRRYNQKLRELDEIVLSKGFFEVSTERFFVIASKNGF